MKIVNKRKVFFAAIIIISIFTLLIAFDNDLTVVNYKVSTDKVNCNIRIALITDLHSCNYGEGQIELLECLYEQKPDIILFGGDIADDDLPIHHTITVLASLGKSYPCFYVTGNHEYWSGEAEEIKQIFRDYGVTVLEGDCYTLEINGQGINVCGIDDPEAGITEFNRQLESIAGNYDKSIYTILLAHRPELINIYLEYELDLIMAGHAHGGQWRIPGILNGLYSPNQGFFPRYAGGQYEFDNTDFIVSRGLAKESTRIPRVFNPPELVIVDIVAKE